MRAALASARCLWAVLIALILTLRLLSPAGFMPAFEHGTITIVACPDGDFEPSTAMTMNHKGQAKHHEQCPYASASPLGTLGADIVLLLGSLVLFGAVLLGRTFEFIERHSRELRPPLRGPPLIV